jgi:hypothetical protein
MDDEPHALNGAAAVHEGPGVAVRDAEIRHDLPQENRAEAGFGPDPDAALLAALAAARARLANEQAVWNTLQDISAKLLPGGNMTDLLGDLLAAAMAITRAEGGCLYLVPAAGATTGSGPVVVTQRRLVDRAGAALESFGAAGSTLLPVHGRVVVADLALSRHESPDLLSAALVDAGYRAYHATALLSRDGRLLGGIVLLSSVPSAPEERDTRVLDLLARQAADFLDRCRADDEAAAMRSGLSAILDSISEAIVSFDIRGTIRTANPAAGRIFGLQPKDLVGQSIGILSDCSGTPSLAAPLIARLSGSDSVLGRRIEHTIRRPGHAALLVELVVTELERGRTFTCVLRDITDRRAQEVRSRQADRLAAMGTLSAGLGHDMNNMLLPVRAHLNALSAFATKHECHECIGHINEIGQAVRYLQQLADGLHYLATDAGHADVGVEGARLLTWWQSTGSLLRRSLPPLCTVEVDIAPNLPAVRVSAHALTQAVLNILVNAGEAILARNDGTVGRIVVSAHVELGGSSVAFSVRDNGMGMSDTVRRRAMDMFFTTKARGLGTGLGLALVNRVAQEAGGTVTLDSEEGVGTTVTLHLPFAVDPRAGRGVRVAIGLADARAAEFMRSAFESRGFAGAAVDDASNADAWIVDPRVVTPEAAASWKAHGRRRTVVLCGRPHKAQAPAWKGIAAGTIPAATDFDSLLVCVDQACSIIDRRAQK